MSLVMRLQARRDGRYDLLVNSSGRCSTFSLRPGLSGAVAEDVLTDQRTTRILERWASASDDRTQIAVVMVGLQLLVEQLECERKGVEPQYLDLREDGS